MPVIADMNTKRVIPNTANSGTLAEMMARRKALAEQMSAMQPKEIGSWTQGAAGALGQIMSGFQQRGLREEETAGRNRLAEIQAGINLDTGANAQQIAEVGMYDPDLAKTLMEGAVQARRDTAQRKYAVEDREDTQTANADAAAARVTAEQAQADARVAAEKAAYTQQNSDKILADEAKVKADALQRLAEQHEANSAYNAKVKADQDAAAKIAAAKEAEPQDEISKAIYEFNRGGYGDKTSENAKIVLQAKIAKETAQAKGIRLSFGPDGTATFEQGGSEGGTGDPTGSTGDLKSKSDLKASILEDAVNANKMLPELDAMEKSLPGLGYSGAGGETWGAVDDAMEGVGSYFGASRETLDKYTPSGNSAARALIDIGGLQQTLQHVQDTKGAVSDTEMGLFGRAKAGLGRSPEANTTILGMGRAIIQRKNVRAQAAQAYANSHGGVVDADFEAGWNDYINKNAVITVGKDGVPYVDQEALKVVPIIGGVSPSNIPPTSTAAPADPAAPAATTAAPAAPAVGGAVESPVAEWSDEEVAAGQIDPAKEARRQAAKGAQRGQP